MYKFIIQFPLSQFTVVHKDPEYLKDIDTLKVYVLGELNIKELILTINN